MPAIVVALDGLAAFVEIMGLETEQRLISLTRECTRCGVYFIVGASAPTDMRMRLKQNFSLRYALLLNDKNDYMDALGISARKVIPPKEEGRGLVALDGEVYVFQTACLSASKEEETEALREFCASLSGRRAKGIPRLPEHVSLGDFESCSESLSKVPIGIICESLEPATIDVKHSLVTRIGAKSTEDALFLIPGLVDSLLACGAKKVSVLDAGGVVDSTAIRGEHIVGSSALGMLSAGARKRGGDGVEVCIVIDPVELLTVYSDSSTCLMSVNADMPTQSLRDGIRYVFVSSITQMKDYSN